MRPYRCPAIVAGPWCPPLTDARGLWRARSSSVSGRGPASVGGLVLEGRLELPASAAPLRQDAPAEVLSVPTDEGLVFRRVEDDVDGGGDEGAEASPRLLDLP